jgi:hypothetical protein
MENQEIRTALDRHWAASAAGDSEAEHEIYHDCAGYISYPLRKLRVPLFNSLVFDDCYTHGVRPGGCSCNPRQELTDQASNIHLV